MDGEMIQAEIPVAFRNYLPEDDYKDYGCFYKTDVDYSDLKFFGRSGNYVGVQFEPHMYGYKNVKVGASWAGYYDLANGQLVDVADARSLAAELSKPKYVPKVVHGSVMVVGKGAWGVVGTVKGWWKKMWG